METSLANEIATKSAALPLAAQQEVLEFVEFKLQRRQQESAPVEAKPLVRSVRGILQGEFPNLEQDIAEMRQEAWKNFPRDFPAEEQQ